MEFAYFSNIRSLLLFAYRFLWKFVYQKIELNDDKPASSIPIEDGIDISQGKPIVVSGPSFARLPVLAPIVGPLSSVTFGCSAVIGSRGGFFFLERS